MKTTHFWSFASIAILFATPHLLHGQEKRVATQQVITEDSSFGNVVWRAHAIDDLTGSALSQQLFAVLENVPESELEAAFSTYRHARKSALSTADLFLTTIREHSQPSFEGENQIRLDGTSNLVVSASWAHQAWVKSFLELQRQDPALIEMASVFCSLPMGSLATLGYSGTSHRLGSESVASFRKKALATQDVNLISMPKVLVYAGQPASIETRTDVSYVADYEIVNAHPGGREIAVPQIEELHSGIKCDLRALPLGADTYTLNVKFEHRRVLEMREFTTTLGGQSSQGLTITLPELESVTLSSRPVLAIGEALLLCSIDEKSGLEYVLLLELQQPPAEPQER